MASVTNADHQNASEDQGSTCSEEEEPLDVEGEEWWSEDEDDCPGEIGPPPVKSRRTSEGVEAGTVSAPGQSPGSSSPAVTVTLSGGSHHHHHHSHRSAVAGKLDATHKPSLKASYKTRKLAATSAGGGWEERVKALAAVALGGGGVPPEAAGWGAREIRRLVYRRGDYMADPNDVLGELTLDPGPLEDSNEINIASSAAQPRKFTQGKGTYSGERESNPSGIINSGSRGIVENTTTSKSDSNGNNPSTSTSSGQHEAFSSSSTTPSTHPAKVENPMITNDLTTQKIIEFYGESLRKLDSLKILGLKPGSFSEDHCILSDLIGPDRHRHRHLLEGIVRLVPETIEMNGSISTISENGSSESSNSTVNLNNAAINSTDSKARQETYTIANELLHTNIFSLQQRLLLATHEMSFGDNLTGYLLDKFLSGVLGSLSVLSRAQGYSRNFIIDNNPSRQLLLADDSPDQVLYSGRPDFLIHLRTETIKDPELFCVVKVHKKCPTIDSDTSKAEADQTTTSGRKAVATCKDTSATSRRISRIRFHDMGDNSAKKRLAHTTYHHASPELLAHILLAYANNRRTCFHSSKYLAMTVHGTKIQLVVAKLKHASVCLDNIKSGYMKPGRKLSFMYTPNMDYLIPEQRQQLLDVLVNLVL